jgi:hypothetical protein
VCDGAGAAAADVEWGAKGIHDVEHAACKPAPIMSSPDTQELFDDVAGLYDEAPVPPPPPPSPWPDLRKCDKLARQDRAKSSSKYAAKDLVRKAMRKLKKAGHTLQLARAQVESGSEATGFWPVSWVEVDGLQRRNEAQTTHLSEAERTERLVRRKLYWLEEEYNLAKQEAESSRDALRDYRRLCSERCRYSTLRREYLHDIRVRARLGYVD